MIGELVVVRGGGDIATGVIQKLYRSGFKVLILEVEKPTAIRRKVSLCEAVYDKSIQVEDLHAVYASNHDEVKQAWSKNLIPIVVDANGDTIEQLKPKIVVDAILAKRNCGTSKKMAPITIALGPGFEAGVDVDVVVETMRGHNLGRLITHGYAAKNTGEPGEIAGFSKERVIYSPASGVLKQVRTIGDHVNQGDVIALIGDIEVKTEISGIIRGLIKEDFLVTKGLKIADVDPRLIEVTNCFTISDKARNIGGAVLEAILMLQNKW